MKPLSLIKICIPNMFGRPRFIIQQVEQLAERMQENLEIVHNQYNELKQMVEGLSSIVHSMNGFLWRKDAAGRYLFANLTMCKSLLVPQIGKIKLSSDCTKAIIGKTDDEILSEYVCSSSGYSTFAETLFIADQHTQKNRQRSEYLEFGNVLGKATLVQSVRTPVFAENGRLEGTIGFGLDVSDRHDDLLLQVRSWINGGMATKLHPSVYLINKQPLSN